MVCDVGIRTKVPMQPISTARLPMRELEESRTSSVVAPRYAACASLIPTRINSVTSKRPAGVVEMMAPVELNTVIQKRPVKGASAVDTVMGPVADDPETDEAEEGFPMQVSPAVTELPLGNEP